MGEQFDGTSRRRILQAGALGAGAAVVGGAVSGVRTASAAGFSSSRPDVEDPRFTL